MLLPSPVFPLLLVLLFSFPTMWVFLLGVGDLRLVEGAPADTELKQFPGYNGSMPSKHYAGYITLDNKGYRSHLYYYFATSERNPSEDPINLFLNGGPGCSVFTGMVHLFGPFELEKNADYMTFGTKVKLKPYSWTKVSNMLFVDSPVGAGYSYAETTEFCGITPLDSSVASQHSYVETSDAYKTDDTETVAELYNFVLKWFSKFPEYLSNPLYLSGTSYGGVYVPAVAQAIVNGIEAGNGPNINFKGYITGNGAIDVDVESRGKVPFAHRMGLISDELYMELNRSCNGKFWNNHNSDCLRNMETFKEHIIGINEYHILFLPCHYEMGLSIPSYEQESVRAYQRLADKVEEDVYCYDYNERPRLLFNSQSSREMLHAMPVEITGEWARCTKRLRYERNLFSVIPFHMNLTTKGYRAFIYSGDHDMVIPPATNLEWIKMLNYSVIEKWRPWFVEDQIAGYTVQYEHNLLFATFRGAGHTVTEYMPREALVAYERWIGGLNNL